MVTRYQKGVLLIDFMTSNLQCFERIKKHIFLYNHVQNQLTDLNDSPFAPKLCSLFDGH